MYEYTIQVSDYVQYILHILQNQGNCKENLKPKQSMFQQLHKHENQH
jgi:hypothetical protein